jgi:hypothetical protein
MARLCPDVTHEIYCYLFGQDIYNFRLAFRNIPEDPLVDINRRYIENDHRLLEYLAARHICYKVMSRNIRLRCVSKYKPEHAFEYVKMNSVHYEYPDILKMIATSPKYSFKLSQLIWMGGKFALGEPAIATSAKYSYNYAMYTNAAFPAGENAMATSSKYAFLYANNVTLKPFPEAEKVIFTDRRYKRNYMLWVLSMTTEEVNRRCSDEGMLADYELNR